MNILSFFLAAIFSITANPGEDTRTQMNVSWGVDAATVQSWLEYSVDGKNSSDWSSSMRVESKGRYTAVFNNAYSKRPNGENFYEDARFFKHEAYLNNLEPKTRYKYRVFALSSSGDTTVSETGLFRTSGSRKWSACIISDFHHYAPLPHRKEAAMNIMSEIEKRKPYDFVINLGDVIAWGGCYSFWEQLYGERQFRDYMWAGVNGNHDNMTRTNQGNTNQFFRNVTANPLNGYEGEEGVCYWFRYSDALFVMLNNENIRDSASFAKAARWTAKVLEENADARYKIVCEHYQWFFGTDGKTSQYGRWHEIFEKYGVDLALAGNNHIYVRAHSNGVEYIQTPSSDNERGQEMFKALTANEDKIDFRWNEGPKTVGAMHIKVTPAKMVLRLYDRNGNVVDKVKVRSKRK